MLHEFTIHYPYLQAESIVDLLNQHDIYTVTYEPVIKVIQTNNGYDYLILEDKEVAIRIYIEEGIYEEVEHYFTVLLANILAIPKEAITYKQLVEEDWTPTFSDIQLNNGWTIQFIGSNFIYDENKTMIFDPQGAFGTGLHETTKDCLDILLDRDFTSESILDLGTGSGILSIACGLKKAKTINAYDIEDVNRQVQYNALLNKVTTISVFQKDVLEQRIEGSYNWIIINIGCHETLEILKKQEFKDCNQFLISGLVEWNEHEVINVMETRGFQKEIRRQTNEWVTILFTRGM